MNKNIIIVILLAVVVGLVVYTLSADFTMSDAQAKAYCQGATFTEDDLTPVNVNGNKWSVFYDFMGSRQRIIYTGVSEAQSKSFIRGMIMAKNWTNPAQ